MFFVEWWLVGELAALLAIFVLSCSAIWIVRRKRTWILTVTAFVASPVGILAGLFFALQVMTTGCLTYSHPIYSPDHSIGARVRTDDEGATGGNSSVELFWNHGLASHDVYWGEWRSVDEQDLHWQGNTVLIITHENPMYSCDSAGRVKVVCVLHSSASSLPIQP